VERAASQEIGNGILCIYCVAKAETLKSSLIYIDDSYCWDDLSADCCSQKLPHCSYENQWQARIKQSCLIHGLIRHASALLIRTESRKPTYKRWKVPPSKFTVSINLKGPWNLGSLNWSLETLRPTHDMVSILLCRVGLCFPRVLSQFPRRLSWRFSWKSVPGNNMRRWRRKESVPTLWCRLLFNSIQDIVTFA